MSVYVLIAAVIIEVIAQIVTVSAVVTLAVQANQIADKEPGIAAGLRAAAAFAGLSIGFALVVMISGFVAIAARKCKKKPILFIIFAILLAISYIISLVITYVYKNQYEAVGNADITRNLNAAFYLIIVGIILHIVAFILFYIVIGKRAKNLSKACKNIDKQTGQGINVKS